ncbi:hypothetical protein [Streptomyces sp. NBC_00102]|uniref:hypothetical protein n=1 Tax=Streptomyces sp. NBC_00102 TaxID=2975652 RepID=UPI00225065A2|nr:hypothetical protein [Streptomyces sp. NBC_00102]MCX5402109.1 hypothetical protein [Streptomyces sp. NBC_00102]
MDTEFATLAASGATTLVSLMVTDSWTQVRELFARLLSPTAPTVVADLDGARDRVLAADAGTSARTVREVTAQWHVHLHHLLRTGSVTSEELRDVLALLRQFDVPARLPAVVHNDINGGVQHGPVIQAGHVSGLTLHTRDQSPAVGPSESAPTR